MKTYKNGVLRAMTRKECSELETARKAAFAVPTMRVKSVPTLAWRRAMRRTPMGESTALDFLEAKAVGDAEVAETLRYMQRAERAEVLTMGLTAEQTDAALALAATLADAADVVWEATPEA